MGENRATPRKIMVNFRTPRTKRFRNLLRKKNKQPSIKDEESERLLTPQE